MFWEDPWLPDEVAAGCQEEWGVTPRRLWAETEWGGRRIGAWLGIGGGGDPLSDCGTGGQVGTAVLVCAAHTTGAASRIVFSNGLLDPWHGGGVLRDVNDDLTTIVIPEVRPEVGHCAVVAPHHTRNVASTQGTARDALACRARTTWTSCSPTQTTPSPSRRPATPSAR